MRFCVQFLICVFGFGCFSQNYNLEIEETTPLKADYFWGVDVYNQIYFSENNVIYKSAKTQNFEFQDLQLGELSNVDILNPLKILLFYKESNTVVFLDNRLNEIERINFNSVSPFKNVEFVNLGKDNSIWLFNVDNQELELYDYENQKIKNKSLPLNISIQNQKCNYNFCWLQNENGLKKFNIYGSLTDEIEIEDLIRFDVFKSDLCMETESEFHLLRAKQSEIQNIKKPKINVEQFHFIGQNLYIYDGKTLHNYKITKVND
ncbi:MAG: hypothetical protein ABR595_02190 [Psychroflexus sp.]